jgi:arabinan endo-1,5-alpha-L-arabinosidase
MRLPHHSDVPRPPRRRRTFASGIALLLALAAAVAMSLSIPSAPATAIEGDDIQAHDPTVIKAEDGCYYSFSTYDVSMSMHRTCDDTPATGWESLGRVWDSVPGWVIERLGQTPTHMWAPDINYFNGQYYLYYSSSYWGQQHTAVTGVATASSPAGPWIDRGMVTDVNYPIDPNVLVANGTMYLMWGSWPGTYMRVIDPATGKLSTTDTRQWRIAGGIENQTVVQDGGYYYLFGSQGVCCSGLDSNYWTVVGRSTSPTGPYLDMSGRNMADGGGTRVLDGAWPKISAGGGDWFTDGDQTMFAYHYYDGQANGLPQLDIRPLTFSGGWPVFGAPLGSSYESITSRSSGQVLDIGAGSTADGAEAIQWPDYNGNSQQWLFQDVGDGYFTVVNRNSNKCLDVTNGSTADGAAVIQWTCGPGWNQQWRVVPMGSDFQLRARHSDKCLNVPGFSTTNGTALVQWTCGGGTNEQWALSTV